MPPNPINHLERAGFPCSLEFLRRCSRRCLPSYVPPPYAGPFAEVGRQTFDGKGKTDATVTVSANGNIFFKVTFEGTYAVNPDFESRTPAEYSGPPSKPDDFHSYRELWRPIPEGTLPARLRSSKMRGCLRFRFLPGCGCRIGEANPVAGSFI